jgi:LysM repeat protein
MIPKWFVLLSVFAIMAASLGFSVTEARAQTTYVNYTVQQGDTLGKVAQEYCTSWKAIYDLNRDTIGKNPNVIHPGMVLTIPANCVPADSGSATPPPASGVYDRGPITHATGIYQAPYYTVAWGDTLSAIGQRFGVDWTLIAQTNGIKGTTIYAGQVLYIPGGSSATVPPTVQGSLERVYFQSGTTSASLSSSINQGIPKSFILWASAGQNLTVNTVSHGEPLVISVTDANGDYLPLTGTNSQIYNNVGAKLPASGDYIVTIKPVTLPESPTLLFDITFIIP